MERFFEKKLDPISYQVDQPGGKLIHFEIIILMGKFQALSRMVFWSTAMREKLKFSKIF